MKEEKVSVTSGKKKASVRKETDAVSVTRPKIVHKQKPEHTAATPSEPTVSRGRSVSRKRSIRGKSNHGSILRQTCRYYLRGTVRERLVNSIKMKRVVRLETSVAKNAVAIVNSVSQLVCVHKIQMHSFLKVESLGETRCRKSWHLFKGSDSLSLRYVMRVSGKRKDLNLEK